jgi:hypothetical protein
VRDFSKYRLLFAFLVYGVFLYLLVPPVFNAHNRGGITFLPKDAGLTMVKPLAERPSTSLAHYRSIWERNVFRTGPGEAHATEATVTELPFADANLGLRLVGTVVIENSGKSLAIVDHEETGQQEACWEGSRLGPVLIKKIFQDRVIIDAGRGEEILSMEPGKGIGFRGASMQLARLDRKEVATALPDYMSLVKTVRIRPHLEAGRPGGILIYNIDPDGLFGKMGLQDGDVIKSVNGEALTVTLDAVAFYNRLKQGGRVTLAVQRGEKNLQLRVHVG